MSASLFHEFLGDILSLYCKTGHKGIEKSFLRLSEAFESGFYKWLSNNKGYASHLQDPRVFESLSFLIYLRNQYPFEAKISDVIKSVVGAKEAQYIPYIVSFSNFMNDPVLGKILFPFRDIIASLSGIKVMGDSIDISLIEKDLRSVVEAYYEQRQKKPAEMKSPAEMKRTVKQQKAEMFLYLLQRFSDELSLAAEQSGFLELASEFRSKILAKSLPYGLGQYLDFKDISDQQFKLSNNMAKQIMKHYDRLYWDYNHDLVDVAFLRASGILSEQDVMELRESFEKNKNIQNIMKGVEDYPGIDTKNKVSIDRRLNTDYLYMLSLFFTFMQKQLDVPSMTYPKL